MSLRSCKLAVYLPYSGVAKRLLARKLYGAGVCKYKTVPGIIHAKLLVQAGYAVVCGAYLLGCHLNGNAVHCVHHVYKGVQIDHNVSIHFKVKVMLYSLVQ